MQIQQDPATFKNTTPNANIASGSTDVNVVQNASPPSSSSSQTAAVAAKRVATSERQPLAPSVQTVQVSDSDRELGSAADPAPTRVRAPPRSTKVDWTWVDIENLHDDVRLAARIAWEMKGYKGEHFCEGNHMRKEYADYFYAVFPMRYLYSSIVPLTNANLHRFSHNA